MTEVGHGNLECLYVLQRRVDAGQGTERDLELIRARNDGGFHWRFDTYFKRMPDGSVRLRTWRHGHDGFPTYEDRTIPPSEWASIVASVSKSGETSESYQGTLTFHMGNIPYPSPGRLVPPHGSGPDNLP